MNNDHPSYGPGSIALVALPEWQTEHEREQMETMFQLTFQLWWREREEALFLPDIRQAAKYVPVPEGLTGNGLLMPSTLAAQWDADFTLVQVMLHDDDFRAWIRAAMGDPDAFYASMAEGE